MDIGLLRMLPNMVLTAPANETEIGLALEFALAEDKPVIIRYPKDLVPPAKLVRAACNKPFRLGKSVTVRRSKRSRIAIVCYGSVLAHALEAADTLSKQRIPADVINARFAAPVDEKILGLLQEGKNVITVEDHHLSCGFGSAVLEMAIDKNTDTLKPDAVRILGVPRRFIGHNSRHCQLMEVGLNADEIVRSAKEMLEKPAAGGKAASRRPKGAD
jgi:1-deoxy-D-xylulose-5-phosphate synthase